MSSLLKSEAEYQEQSQQIRNAAKEEKISLPSLYYQKQFLCVMHIEDTIGMILLIIASVLFYILF